MSRKGQLLFDNKRLENDHPVHFNQEVDCYLKRRAFTAPLNHVRWPWLKSASKFDRDLYQWILYVF